MIKIIFLADTHLGFDYPLKPKKERQRRGPDFFANFDKVLQYAKDSKADLIIHGGDLFYRTKVPQPIVDMVYERIFNIADFGIPMVIVPGNHESSTLPISLYMQHPNIYYYTKAQTFKFNIKGIELDIAGFPCVRNGIKSEFPNLLAQLTPQLSQDSIKLLCIHQSVEGAQVGPSDYTFRYGDDVIPISDIPNTYKALLSGHIHRKQILKSTNKTPIIYPGSIERTAFAEKDETKGFYELTIDKNKLTHKFHSLPARPMVDIVLDREKYTESTLQNDILLQMEGISKNSVLRIKAAYPENNRLLRVRLLDSLIPETMVYQLSGVQEYKKVN